MASSLPCLFPSGAQDLFTCLRLTQRSQRCTKYHVRCPYNDMPIAYDQEGSLQGPDLMWTPEIVANVEQWKQTGIAPFPYFDTSSPFRAEERSPAELRLIHHICSIFAGLEVIEANHFTLWTRYIPAYVLHTQPRSYFGLNHPMFSIINIGCTHGFVLESLLAFSATHIAWLTGCPQVEGLAYEHRITALQGLQEAINTFSRETADAILAASLVLTWQATDWYAHNNFEAWERVMLTAQSYPGQAGTSSYTGPPRSRKP